MMMRKKSKMMRFGAALVVALLAMLVLPNSPCWAQTQSAPPAIAKRIGTVKAINGSTLTLAVTSNPDVNVTVLPSARILRLAPGEKDLKNATPVQLQDVHVGDNVRVRGQGSEDGKSISALEIVVITSTALNAVRDQIREDWQKRGLGGIVSAVDPAAGTATITIPSLTEKKTVVIHASNSTVIRRYAPDSANFEAAQPSTLQAIHVGDQLRARGDRSADGNDFTAAEIVAGAFPYVEGTIKSVDASANTLTVQDVLSKKAVQLKISSESQLHQIPAEAAQRMAMMLKAAKSGAAGAGMTNKGANGSGGAPSGMKPSDAASSAPSASGVQRPGGGSGFQRMLEQTPAVVLGDLHKGDVVAILATEGSASAGGTVIKLFSGVEPILTATPSASQAMMLSPWSLGGSPGGEGMQ
jgi:hypothetical protein